ncbi:response regulator transcription factor [Soonwooa sp.]|uniref:response regulator transcription factor n=1 Tax=Soonwooa sp. TaxID=1938592 RepID=UPI0028A60E81|nr:response regulator transcription factor [Soonwooa sp.]
MKKVIDYNNQMNCVGQFFSGKAALDSLADLDPDIVLMDLQLYDSWGTNVIRTIKIKNSRIQFIICTNHEDDDKVFDALRSAAVGYLVKGESLEKIIQAIITAKNGGSPMSNNIAKKVLCHFQNQEQDFQMVEELTTTEKYILQGLAEGLQYKEIAANKGVSTETVKKHVGSIYRKLNVNNKVEALNKLNHNKFLL